MKLDDVKAQASRRAATESDLSNAMHTKKPKRLRTPPPDCVGVAIIHLRDQLTQYELQAERAKEAGEEPSELSQGLYRSTQRTVRWLESVIGWSPQTEAERERERHHARQIEKARMGLL